MGDIKNFMVAAPAAETRSIIISDRFKDKDGNPVPFVIKVLTQEENEKLHKRASKPVKKNGVVVTETTDSELYGKLLVLESVVEPNLRDAELGKFYGTMDPLEVASKMLTAGEYGKLANAISDLNGFSDIEVEVLEEEAKNL